MKVFCFSLEYVALRRIGFDCDYSWNPDSIYTCSQKNRHPNKLIRIHKDNQLKKQYIVTGKFSTYIQTLNIINNALSKVVFS